MTVVFHPMIRKDLRGILAYYDEQSESAGDRFFEEFEAKVAEIKESPLHFPPLDHRRRRCNLSKFPYH